MTKNKSLIYDVGMHKGEDTEFYLKKGFSVIAFEADPELVQYCRIHFRNALAGGKLTIVEGAIVDVSKLDAHKESIRFYKNAVISVWGTIYDTWAYRNKCHGAPSQIIEVKTVDFRACVDRYGVPYYMKIDIEGADVICLEALRHFGVKPDYISIESEKAVFSKLEQEFNVLTDLGYPGFEIVRQDNIGNQVVPDPPLEGGYAPCAGASGLFGKELTQTWKSRDEALREYAEIFRSGDSINRWYDTHAKHATAE